MKSALWWWHRNRWGVVATDVVLIVVGFLVTQAVSIDCSPVGFWLESTKLVFWCDLHTRALSVLGVSLQQYAVSPCRDVVYPVLLLSLVRFTGIAGSGSGALLLFLGGYGKPLTGITLVTTSPSNRR